MKFYVFFLFFSVSVRAYNLDNLKNLATDPSSTEETIKEELKKLSFAQLEDIRCKVVGGVNIPSIARSDNDKKEFIVLILSKGDVATYFAKKKS